MIEKEIQNPRSKKLADDRKIDVTVNIDEERVKCGLLGNAEPIQALYMLMQPSAERHTYREGFQAVFMNRDCIPDKREPPERLKGHHG